MPVFASWKRAQTKRTTYCWWCVSKSGVSVGRVDDNPECQDTAAGVRLRARGRGRKNVRAERTPEARQGMREARRSVELRCGVHKRGEWVRFDARYTETEEKQDNHDTSHGVAQGNDNDDMGAKGREKDTEPATSAAAATADATG